MVVAGSTFPTATFFIFEALPAEESCQIRSNELTARDLVA